MAPIHAPSLHISHSKTLTLRNQLNSNNNQFIHDEKMIVEGGLVEAVDSPFSKVEKESKQHRIWLSNVMVKRPKIGLVERKWHFMGVIKLVTMSIVHVLAMFGPFTFSWAGLRLALFLHVLFGMFGVTLSFHRNLAHKSFTLPKWLEYFFAYLGSLALQGDPMRWVETHRYHHKYVDSERDPHSPLIEGFWHSHITWIFDINTLLEKYDKSNIVKDMEAQKFYRFMRKTYILHYLALGLLLYAFGGFSYVVWGIGVRTTFSFHVTFFVNSACHVWGSQAWNTDDSSKNNWWVGLLAGGEGWHNNHHAFEYSARHGLEWWQIDLTWYAIKLLEAIGLAKDVKLPTQAHKQRLAFKPEMY